MMKVQKRKVEVTPAVGDSVFMGFVSNGEGRILPKQALNPFDKVQAIYEGTSKTKLGDTIYSVRLASGDAVSVVKYKNMWKAVR